MAPRDSRYSALCEDAVVMIDENPESLASWIAGRVLTPQQCARLSMTSTYHIGRVSRRLP